MIHLKFNDLEHNNSYDYTNLAAFAAAVLILWTGLFGSGAYGAATKGGKLGEAVYKTADKSFSGEEAYIEASYVYFELLDEAAAELDEAAIESEAEENGADILEAASVSEQPEQVQAPAAACRYPLTDEERKLILSVIMAEARGEPYEGQMMIAQCILDGAERNGLTIAESVSAYRMAGSSLAPSDSVIEATAAVFDRGERVTEAQADLWYAPGVCHSGWHETQQYVTTIGGHKFFWCNANIR